MQQRIVWTAGFDDIEVPAILRQSKDIEWISDNVRIQERQLELDGDGYVRQQFSETTTFGDEDYIRLERQEGGVREVAFLLVKSVFKK